MSRTDNQKIVDDIALVMSPAVVTDVSILQRAASLASFLGNPSEFADYVMSHIDSGFEHTYIRPVEMPLWPGTTTTINVETTEYTEVKSETIRHAISSARNNVNEIVDTVSSFASRAAAVGFHPPSNPFIEVMRLRSLSKGAYVDVDASRANDIVFNITTYIKLISAEYNGEINMNGSIVTGAAQLSHVGFSTDGFVDFASNSANQDLISFLADSDSIKRKIASDALAAFDFSKRAPKIIFTCKYDPDGIVRGAIVGWRRMADASGYVIHRHDVFSNKDVTFTLSNSRAIESYEIIKDYVREWVLSFYDGIPDDHVYAFLDTSIEKDKYYTYTMEAYQNVKNPEESVFDVEISIGSTSYAQLNAVENRMKNVISVRFEESSEVTIDDISPYPLISTLFYDDNRFDWILAGINVLASARRGDDRSTVRGYSYIGSKMSFLKEKIQNTEFFLPKDINAVLENISTSVSSYGVSKTILEILDKTGMLFFFDSKESVLSDSFQRASDVVIDSSSKLYEILSAIDPETATISVSSLLSNLAKDSTERSDSQTYKPTEIEITPTNTTNNEISEDFLQYAGSIVAGDDVLDLTTVDGIGKFMQIIRGHYDFSKSTGITVGWKQSAPSMQELAK